jgi:hypothetical protein
VQNLHAIKACNGRMMMLAPKLEIPAHNKNAQQAKLKIWRSTSAGMSCFFQITRSSNSRIETYYPTCTHCFPCFKEPHYPDKAYRDVRWCERCSGGLFSPPAIYSIRHWRLSSISLFIKLVQALNPRDGRKGSLAKFGCGVCFERFANVPCSEGMVYFNRIWLNISITISFLKVQKHQESIFSLYSYLIHLHLLILVLDEHNFCISVPDCLNGKNLTSRYCFPQSILSNHLEHNHKAFL